MRVLCDTSVVLMLLRIAPDMFVDERYECVTVKEVHDEIVRTTKFKSKYPWTKELRSKIKIISVNKSKKERINLYFSAISELNNTGTINKTTGRLFDLSFTDRKIASSTLALGYKITSGDRDLVTFCKQEFSKECKGAVSPLGIINRWVEKKLIDWDDTKQEYLTDWSENREHPQPDKAKRKFENLTGREYTGS